MKLESTLPEGVGFLHAIPLFNLLAVIVMCYALGPLLEEKTGIEVRLPASMFQVERFEEAGVITLTAGDNARMYWNSKSVSMLELTNLLDETAAHRSAANAAVIIRADALVSHELVQQIDELCLKKNLRVVHAGSEMGKAVKKD